MMEVDKSTIVGLFPRALTPEEDTRLDNLIRSAVRTIDTAFLREGRSFTEELATVPWLDPVAQEVVEDMVAAAVLVGSNVGYTSVSSTSGPQSDSAGFRDTLKWTSWRGVKLTDEQRRELGLSVGARAFYRTVPPIAWPERRL